MVNRVIAWDRDQTLGLFDRLGARIRGVDPEKIEKSRLPPDGLKTGIIDLLGHLLSEGYRHYVVTIGSPETADQKLQMAGLQRFFEKQFAGEEYIRSTFKIYLPVLQAAGIRPEDAPERLLVIGDYLLDLPGDLVDTVFVHHEDGCFYHSDVLRQLIRELDRPDGGFIAGFNALYGRARSADGKDFIEDCGVSRRADKTLDIGNGIRITLGDRYNPMTKEVGGRYVGRIPTITRIEAPGYRREVLEPLQGS